MSEDTSVVRGSDKYKIVREYSPSDGKDYATVEFRDTEKYVSVHVSGFSHSKGEFYHEFRIDKGTARVEGIGELSPGEAIRVGGRNGTRAFRRGRDGSQIAYEDTGERADEDMIVDEHEGNLARRYLHEVAEGHANEAEIYRAAIRELDRIEKFRYMGKLLDEFHQKEEPEFYERVKGGGKENPGQEKVR